MTVTTENLNAIRTRLTVHVRSRFDAAITRFLNGLEAGKIYNVFYKEGSEAINGAIEDAAKVVAHPFYDLLWKGDSREKADTHDAARDALDCLYFLTMHTSKARQKALAKAGDVPHRAEIADLIAAAVALGELQAKLKPMIVKGRVPNPNAVPAYVPPPTTQVVLDQIADVLTDQIASTIEEYRTDLEAHLILAVDRYKAMTEEEQFTTGNFGQMIMLVGKPVYRNVTVQSHGRTAHRQQTRYEIVPQYRKILAKVATDSAEAVRQNFVAKNGAKLGKIVENKGNFKGVASQYAHTRQGSVEAQMRITFEDGSAFNVRNKVVNKWSTRGQPFAQYPTTFHDVVLPDGSRMTEVSEETMVERFSKG